MLRAAALSLLVLVSVAVTLPLVDSSAHNSGRPAAVRRHLKHRHSRAWWRRYRARLRRQRAAQRRRQALQIKSSERGQSLNAMADSHKSAPGSAKLPVVTNFKNAVTAPSLALPSGWTRRASANGDMKFVVNGQNGFFGEATLALVNAQAQGEAFAGARGQRKTLSGVPLADLRRTVIDKMIVANGWVVNDLVREIEGKPVFIVLAQTAASSDGRTPQQSWVFFFTEVGGRIYSLAANAPQEFSDRIANEAALLMASFQANSRAALAGVPQR